MALQIAISALDTLVGTDCPESYVKVEFVRAWKGDSLIWVNWYADAQARFDLKQPVKQKEFAAPTTSLVGANIIEASYVWLKTLPEFVGAIDVLVNPVTVLLPEPSEIIEIPVLVGPAPSEPEPVLVEPAIDQAPTEV